MREVTSETATVARPYKPSWIDRLNAWIAAQPAGAATVYVGIGGLLVLVQLLVLWLEGGWEATEILPIIVYNGLATPYLLALIHLTDEQAGTAIDAVRPLFAATERELEVYAYRLTTMPFPSSLIAGSIATVSTILTERLSGVPIRYAPLEQLPAFAVVFQIVDKSSAFVFGVLIYHMVRQLWLVNTLNASHLRIKLFHTSALQGFSRLTASTAVGLVAFVYLWMFINPEILHDPLILGYAVVLTALAVAVFAWPLLGIHRLVGREKARALYDLDLQLEVAFAAYHQHLEEGNDAALDPLNGRIAALETQHRVVSSIPTWPWQPETGRLVLTAVALPLVLMMLQYIIEQALR